ncbi:L,D-transpeptidase family protein [Neobacillus sp. OS1-33]|uniref:L,D-transpeptidase family protein n=1 Tax=Neobacillus sp. OS1-33 TaxID=3070683 RepID=UPI0027DF3786|nr:L,D-transpeptidase family protein [Neobacillus sp. OS1-33]WML24844.1 L,D-transpeptidase family protein [Neobacillus sp. OS1-33]
MLRRFLIGFIIFFLGFSVLPQAQKAEASTISKKQLIIVNKKINKLAFYENGKLVKTYRVATGRTSRLTPEGTFYIREKIKNRPYYKHNIPGGDPRNPLGKRWMGLSKQENGGYPYAIHGNANESSIGKYISGGCIRMHNNEVVELFKKVNIGAKVVITTSKKSFNQLAAPYYKNIDISAPTFSYVSPVSDKSNEVSGITEKGATVTVKIGSKKIIKKADSKGKFKVTIGKQTAGKKIYLSAKDPSGNISKTKIVDVKDKTAPVVSGVNNKAFYNKDVKITFNEGTATLNGKAIKSGYVAKAAGKRTLVVTDKDKNKTTVVFTIDKTAPVIKGVSNNAFYNRDVTIVFNEGTATLNGKAIKSGYVAKVAGKRTLVVTDAAGNKKKIVFTIDKTAPVVTGVSNGTFNMDVTISFNEGTATLDGNVVTKGTVVSEEGEHTLVVTDAAGNKKKIVFTIDKTAPVVTGVSNGTFDMDVTISFNEGTATLDGNVVTTGTVVSEEGDHTLVVTDAAKNKTTVVFTIKKAEAMVE